MRALGTVARQDAVIRYSPSFGTLLVSGPDRSTWLNGLVTCDVSQLAAGQGSWGLLLNRLGKIQSVLWVLSDGERLRLAAAPGTLERVQGELERMLIMEDAELERSETESVWFALHGPKARERALDLARAVNGVAASIDWTGLGGAALSVPRARAEAILELCADSLLDDAAWTELRLERGLPEFGIDFGEQDRPHEAGLERRAISWSKGCYLGQEVVCMQDMRGKVKRSIRVLEVLAPPGTSWGPNQPLLDASGQPAGDVTSRAYSELAQRWLLMAQVRLDAGESFTLASAPGTTWQAKPFAGI
jgi:tRNA-modifying protein YgfZ